VHVLIDAPAKVNLCLLVGPRRLDGYHELFSVFVPVDLYDEIEFSLTLLPSGTDAGTDPIELRCPGIEDGDNLVIKALRAVERLSGRSFTGSVRIEKRIPIGAGMGGGSSDAAAALGAAARLLDEESAIHMGPTQLHDLARSLGADVPFFLQGRPAVAKGIGDRLEAIDIPAMSLVLLLPQEHLGTKEVYGEFDRLWATGDDRRFSENVARAEAAWARLSVASGGSGIGGGEAAAAISEILENDLEAASFSLLPELIGRKKAIEEAGALGSLMSGSGPTLFGLCASPDHAAEVGRRLEARGYCTRTVRTP
jgi:4-diphosphocytidyl-2-C-methyl-D-erythritol kinase